jgi:tRNA pseudouridine(38-40) synthase
MQTIKLTLEYDGTNYAGWQRQADQPTVQAVLEQVIGQVTQATLSVVGAGRTDSGVHALGQVASFRTERCLSSGEWSRALNGLLPEDICVRSVEFASDDFHARYSAVGKLYEYRILNRPDRSALDRHRAWHLRKGLDGDAMQEAAQYLIGRRDFSSSRLSDRQPEPLLQPPTTVDPNGTRVANRSLCRPISQADGAGPSGNARGSRTGETDAGESRGHSRGSQSIRSRQDRSGPWIVSGSRRLLASLLSR